MKNSVWLVVFLLLTGVAIQQTMHSGEFLASTIKKEPINDVTIKPEDSSEHAALDVLGNYSIELKNEGEVLPNGDQSMTTSSTVVGELSVVKDGEGLYVIGRRVRIELRLNETRYGKGERQISRAFAEGIRLDKISSAGEPLQRNMALQLRAILVDPINVIIDEEGVLDDSLTGMDENGAYLAAITPLRGSSDDSRTAFEVTLVKRAGMQMRSDGSWRYAFQAGHLHNVRGRRQETFVKNGAIVGKKTTVISLQRVAGSSLARLRRVQIPSTPKGDSMESHQNRIIQRSYLQIDTSNTIKQAVRMRDFSKPQQVAKIMTKLKAKLIQDPDAAQEIERELHDATLPREMFALMVWALGESGGLAAEESLLNLGQVFGRDPYRGRQILRAMGAIKVPSNKVQGWLMAKVGDPEYPLQHAANHQVGALIYNLRRNGADGAAKKLFQSVVPLSRRLGDHQLMAMLGNAAIVEALPLIKQALRSATARHRYWAIDGLRRYEHPEAEHLLVERVEQDRDPNNRRLAMIHLSKRPIAPATVKRIKLAIQREADQDVRSKQVSFLWIHRLSFPEVRDLLIDLSAADPSPILRKKIGRLLAGR